MGTISADGEHQGAGWSVLWCKTAGSGCARPSFFLAETHRRLFGVASCAQHRVVEVERHPRKPLGQQALNDQVPRLTAGFLDADPISASERAANGERIRQTLQATRPLDYSVIVVAVRIQQPTMLNDEVHDGQQHHDHLMAVSRTHLQEAKASHSRLLSIREKKC